MQTTSKVFMVMPVRFGYNDETATNNVFQKKGYENGAQENALREFMSFISLLKANGINVFIAEDSDYPPTPDSIFPNNWFSTHEDGTLVLYPMYAENRRAERKSEFLNVINSNCEIRRLVDLSHWEEDGLFLEGSGSMVFDRDNKIVYACRSSRTSEKVLEDFCKQMNYSSVVFDASDDEGNEIYHTNVMMSIGTRYAVLCKDAIREGKEEVVKSLENTGKEIIEISMDQMKHFAGNMLELHNNKGQKYIIMSATARKSLKPEQNRKLLAYYQRILSPQLDTIELNGGGSARCMMAELF